MDYTEPLIPKEVKFESQEPKYTSEELESPRPANNQSDNYSVVSIYNLDMFASPGRFKEEEKNVFEISKEPIKNAVVQPPMISPVSGKIP